MAPPRISITCVIPGTTISANTGRVELSWSVSDSPPDAAKAIWLGYGSPGYDILADDTFTAWGYSHSNVFPKTSDTFAGEVSQTLGVDIGATNDDGSTIDREILYSKIPVGYYNASVPGAPVRESELELIREYLNEIETKLRSNILATLPEYLEMWSHIDSTRFPDSFGDMEYLSGDVGTGGLADDILNAMQNVLIYTTAHTMPRGFRPGTITRSGGRALCEEIDIGFLYGIATREWVSICVDRGADGLTLLHELFHYASRSNNHDEGRATIISLCAYEYIP